LLEIDEYKLESAHELSEQQAETTGSGNEPTAEEISIVPENENSARTESAGSGNEPRTSTSGLLDCIPGPSKSSNADERKLKTPQKRKKHQEDESSSDVIQKRRNLVRKCRKLEQGEKTSVSQSNKNRNPSLIGNPKNNPEIQAFSKKQKIGNPVAAIESRKASSATKNAANQKKSWECDECKKKFGFKWNLLAHLQSHSTTKNFKCSICRKAFKTANNKYQHEQIHTPKVRCKICGKESKNKIALSQHHAFMHSDQRKAECGICKKILSSKQKLRYHEKKVHNLI
jgi:hypothetical protein